MDRPHHSRKRRWLRWLLWPVIGLACATVVIPTLQAFALRHRVMSAVRSAQSVRLEGFRSDGVVLAKVELDREQREEIASAMPLLPDIGVPGLIALCFIPRNRIVVSDSSEQETQFLICFECDEVGFFDEAISMTPVFWRSPLRRLFTDHGIPVLEPDERYKLSLRQGELGVPLEGA